MTRTLIRTHNKTCNKSTTGTIQFIYLSTRRFERAPVLEPKHWWHKVPIKRKTTYRRLALETLGASNLISEHSIVRAHDR